jgi:hypothetical protein
MKKTLAILLIVGATAIGSGFIVMTVAAACVGFDATRLSNSTPYVYADYESPKAFTTIAIEDTSAAVTIETSPDSQVHIHYGENNHEKYVFADDGANLSLTVDSSAYSWFDFLSWARPQKTLALSLPSSYGAELDVSVANGSITLTNMSMTDTVRLETKNGAISVNNLSAESLTLSDMNGAESVQNTTLSGKLECTNSNGSITAKTIVAPTSATLHTASGSIDVNGLSSSSIDIETLNGHEDVKNVVSATDLSIANSNGWIGLSAIDVSNAINLTTSNGSISGNLKGPMSDYTINSHTGSGSNNLPSYLAATTGSKSLHAQVGNGSINLTFVV